MRCAWNELLKILPPNIRTDVDRLGRETLQEIRLRLGKRVQLVMRKESLFLETVCTDSDLSFVVGCASKYSPWAAATSAQGYLTAPGGHRIGMCGDAVTSSGNMTGIRKLTSLCVRVARDFPGIAQGLNNRKGNILIIGPPGSGKTTLLRDLIREVSNFDQGSIAVVDERGEIFPAGFDCGKSTDVMTGCSKRQGLMMALRTMGPTCIAMDEITAIEDIDALTQALWCGVRIIATMHAANMEDLKVRPVFAPINASGVFDEIVILRKDKSWRSERVT